MTMLCIHPRCCNRINSARDVGVNESRSNTGHKMNSASDMNGDCGVGVGGNASILE